MANSLDPDQTAQVCLQLWVCTVHPCNKGLYMGERFNILAWCLFYNYLLHGIWLLSMGYRYSSTSASTLVQSDLDLHCLLLGQVSNCFQAQENLPE
jgi:hypothetical protein